MRKGILILMASALVFGALACKSDKKSGSDKKEDTETTQKASSFEKNVTFSATPIIGSSFDKFLKVGIPDGKTLLLLEGKQSEESDTWVISTTIELETLDPSYLFRGGQWWSVDETNDNTLSLILLEEKGSPIDSLYTTMDVNKEVENSLYFETPQKFRINFTRNVDRNKFEEIKKNVTAVQLSVNFAMAYVIFDTSLKIEDIERVNIPKNLDMLEETNSGRGLNSQEEVSEDDVLKIAPRQENNSNNNQIFTVVEQPAEFPGGQEALNKWRSSNIRYPQSAIDNGISGRVVVRFVVEKDGSVSNVTVLKGVDKDLDAEAIRVVKRMPKWTPAKNNGHPVRSYFTLPVNFSLPN